MSKVKLEEVYALIKDGNILPLSFTWSNGREYFISHIYEIQPAASLKLGGYGLRYTVQICGQQKEMWLFPENEWFIDGKD